MRRLFWPLCSPTRRLALVAAAALLLFAWLVPYRPRYVGPTGGQVLMGFSPDGRHLALRNQDYSINAWADQLHSETVLIHDLTAAAMPERPCEINLFTLRTAQEPFPASLFWAYVRDRSLRRRLLAQVYGDAALAADERDWPALGVLDASADGKYWAYKTVDGKPRVSKSFVNPSAVGLVVREVATGRVAATVPERMWYCAFGPGPDALTTVHFDDPSTNGPYRVERWSLTTGERRTPPDWPRFPDVMPRPAPGGRYVVIAVANHAEHRFYDTLDGLRLAKTVTLPTVPNRFYLGTAGGRCVGAASGAGESEWVRVWALDRDEPVALDSPPGPAAALVGAAADGSRVAVAVAPAAAAPAWYWLADVAARAGVDLQPRPKLWVLDTATGRAEADLPGPAGLGWRSTAAFSDDGRQFAFVGGGLLHVYDLPLRRPWAIILGGTALAALAFVAIDWCVRRWRRRGQPA